MTGWLTPYVSARGTETICISRRLYSSFYSSPTLPLTYKETSLAKYPVVSPCTVQLGYVYIVRVSYFRTLVYNVYYEQRITDARLLFCKVCSLRLSSSLVLHNN